MTNRLKSQNDILGKGKLLIACPVHTIKEYSLEEWLEATQNYKADLIWIDNSDDLYKRWQHRIKIDRFPAQGGVYQRVAESMERIRELFLAGNWEYLLILESDIIGPPNLLEVLNELLKDNDCLSLGYWGRGSKTSWIRGGFGCCLLRRKMVEQEHFWDGKDISRSNDGWFWSQVSGKYKIAKPLDVDILEHLGEGVAWN